MPRRAIPSVFICYRREEGSFPAFVLRSALTERWGTHSVFIDREIRPGDEFPDELERQIAQSDFVVAVIGPHWLTPRLNDPADWVRRELRMADSRRKRVVPILVDGARMPRADELPSDISFVASRMAHELTHASWQSDVDRLAGDLEESMPPLPSAWRTWSETTSIPWADRVHAMVPEPVLAGGGLALLAAITHEPVLYAVAAVGFAVFAIINMFDRRRATARGGPRGGSHVRR